MHIEFIARLCTKQRPLMNSDLVFEGQGHSGRPHSRACFGLLSLPCDPYCGRPTAVCSLPPRKTCTDQFLSICGQTLKRAKVVRTCLAGQPAIRSSCTATGWLRSVYARLPLSVPRSSWNPGICRRLFKIRLTLRTTQEQKKQARKKSWSQSSITLWRSFAINIA